MAIFLIGNNYGLKPKNRVHVATKHIAPADSESLLLCSQETFTVTFFTVFSNVSQTVFVKTPTTTRTPVSELWTAK